MPYCECGNPSRKVTGGPCATCERDQRKELEQEKKQLRDHQKKVQMAKKGQKPIQAVSDKQAEALSGYYRESKEWLRGKRCAVYPTLSAKEVHHRKGREINAYADDWARENGVSLLMDKRFWLPVSRVGHAMIEAKPEWAKEKGFSLDRL